MAKRNTGTRRDDAPLVIALGPGFVAGDDCHAVIETNRGHWLGRVIWVGPAQADTKVPAEIAGRQADRALRSPAEGVIRTHALIGDRLAPGDLIATVGEKAASFPGVLRRSRWAGGYSRVEDSDLDAPCRGTLFHHFDKSQAVAGGWKRSCPSACGGFDAVGAPGGSMNLSVALGIRRQDVITGRWGGKTT
jgi:hypothetical protein